MLDYILGNSENTKKQRQYNEAVRAQGLEQATIFPKFIKPAALLGASILSYVYAPPLPGLLFAIAGVSAASVFVGREHAKVKAYYEYVIKLDDDVRKLDRQELKDFVQGTEAAMGVCPEVPLIPHSKAYLAGYEAQSVNDITLVNRVSEQNRAQNKRFRQ